MAIATTAQATTSTSARRRVRNAQPGTREPCPVRCQSVIRRTMPTSSAEPGIESTKKTATSWFSAP